MINSQRYKAETNLTVNAAHAIVLHTVEKKYEERHDTRHEDQHRYDSQNLGINQSILSSSQVNLFLL